MTQASLDLGLAPRDAEVEVILSLLPGSSREDVEPLLHDLGTASLTPYWRLGNDWVLVSGRVEDVGGALSVQLRRYIARSGVEFIAPTTTPSVPAAWRPLVRGLDVLNGYPRAGSMAVRAGGMTPNDVVTAYNMRPLHELGIDGSGQTVVVTVPGDGYRQAALDEFTSRFGLPPLTLVSKADDPLMIEAGAELEMDVETIHAIAPGARILVYASAKTSIGSMLEIQDRAVVENPGAILSQSWGWCEPITPTAVLDANEAIYELAAEARTTAFFSSGDNGAFSCLTENDDWGRPPSDDRIGAHMGASMPGITSVGGTRLSLREDGSYYHETAWTWPAGTSGSGGGHSTYYAQPPWQFGPGIPEPVEGAKRLYPDIAADAESGMAIYLTKYGWTTGGGTSQSVPIWAGMTALINGYLARQELPPVGFLTPLLYQLARDPQPFPPFHDIVQGSNLVEPTVSGYDTTTGLGSPDAWNLARDLEQLLRASGGTP